jgi:crotonobetainyl-CoA:carnitine CoA-transferase CaiB-like acyl-CoA transferase
VGAIAVMTDEEWNKFGQAIGNPDWANSPEFATAAGRVAQSDRLDRLVESWTVLYPPEAVTEILQKAGVLSADFWLADILE